MKKNKILLKKLGLVSNEKHFGKQMIQKINDRLYEFDKNKTLLLQGLAIICRNGIIFLSELEELVTPKTSDSANKSSSGPQQDTKKGQKRKSTSKSHSQSSSMH